MKTTLVLLLLLISLASFGLAQPNPSFNLTAVQSPNQPNDSNTTSRGPDYVVASFIISCFCYGYEWRYDINGFYKKLTFAFYAYPADAMNAHTIFIVGKNGVCSEDNYINKHTDLWFLPNGDFPIPGIYTEIKISWVYVYTGFPYNLHDRWDTYCDYEQTVIERNPVLGSFPC